MSRKPYLIPVEGTSSSASHSLGTTEQELIWRIENYAPSHYAKIGYDDVWYMPFMKLLKAYLASLPKKA